MRGSTVPAMEWLRISVLDMKSFGDSFNPRDNGFAFLRFTLAALVMLSHSYALGGFGLQPFVSTLGRDYSLGSVAVAMFFVLSGFLITRSAQNTASIGRFLWHRFLRIVPGYWTCLLVTVLLFAPFLFWIDHNNIKVIFQVGDYSPWTYLTRNLSLLHVDDFSIEGILNLRQLSIAGVLNHNPHPGIINGSLWTLPYELICYLAIGIFAVFGIIRRAPGALAGIFLIFWGLEALLCISPQLFWDCFPYARMSELVTLSLYFAAGSVAFLYRRKIPFTRRLFITAILLLGAGIFSGLFGVIAPIAMSYLFLSIAFKLRLKWFDDPGDFSYGIYIYAFPVQQTLAALKVQESGLLLYFVSSFLVTLLFAVASFRLIEGPCLRLKKLTLPIWFSRESRSFTRAHELTGQTESSVTTLGA
jgi:peptidoglycan/LPS O-acetylase OafA/YrhL